MSTLASVIILDVFSARPSAGIIGRLFFASDTGAAYRDNGTSWDELSVGGGANFSDGEVVSGSGTAFSLAYAPSPAESLILVQRLAGYGGIVLFHEEGSPAVGDYTLSGTSLAMTNSIAAGELRAWYRY